MNREKKIHAINGEKGLTFCGRDPEKVTVTDGTMKVTCKTCLRVAGKMVQEMEKEVVMENAVDTVELEGLVPLNNRIPLAFTEVKFVGLDTHHLEAINSFARILSIQGKLPQVDIPEDPDPVAMIGIKDELGNIKMELQSAWSIVRTVRGQGCPKNMLSYRELEDNELAGLALYRSFRRGMITPEELSWAVKVSHELGEPCSSLDEDNMKHWEANKARDKKMDSNDMVYPEGEWVHCVATWDHHTKTWLDYSGPDTLVDLDEPIDRPVRVGNEARFKTTEGDFGQVQVLCDLGHEMKYDLWLEERVNKFDGSTYGDPQGRTKAAIMSALRELMDREFKVVDQVVDNKPVKMLVWKFFGISNSWHEGKIRVDGTITAGAMRSGKTDTAPWKVAIPMEMVYRHLGTKDENFGILLNLVKDLMLKEEKLGTKINWRARQRMLRIWHTLKGNEEFMPRHLVVKVWIHKDKEWRVALGLPSAPAARQTPPPARHTPPPTNGGTSLPQAAG